MRRIAPDTVDLNLRERLADERGMTLLEVLVSTVVLGIALAGFLMALSTAASTSRISADENQIVHLANMEFERLRSRDFEDVPFFQTSEPGIIEEVPNYFKDLALIPDAGGDVRVFASGDLPGAMMTYSRELAFDGKRANFNSRWMGGENALRYKPTGSTPGAGEPGTGGPGGGPGTGGPGGGPITDGGFAPDNFQWICCTFPDVTKISRILYDSRFNVTETMGAPAGDFDYLPHERNVWQSHFEFFYSADVVGPDEMFSLWGTTTEYLSITNDTGYGTGGIIPVFDWMADNDGEPLEAAVIGVANIDTYSDFDMNFHWPYVSEIEVYGFANATSFVDIYRPADGGEPTYNNIIMYFPNYLGSGFDMGRWVYVEPTDVEGSEEEQAEDIVRSRQNLIRVILEFYPASNANLSETWQKEIWWQSDTNEMARFQTTFYRDEASRVDRLPNLGDLPVHMVYGENEDLDFPFTVPGASEIRARFGTFDLGPGDTVTIEDADGNIYDGPVGDVSYANERTPWVPGDTIVIHFISDGAGDTYDGGYGGFKVEEVEVKWVGLGGELQ